mgnify:CR=1 FL=1
MDIQHLQRNIESRRKGWYNDYPEEECIKAIQTVAKRADGELTHSTYEENKDTSHPAISTIRKRTGLTWNELKEEYLE